MIQIQYNTNGELNMINHNLLYVNLSYNYNNIRMNLMQVINGRVNMIAYRLNIELY
jgi:hypothetical protein